jgi:hypothetical protein
VASIGRISRSGVVGAITTTPLAATMIVVAFAQRHLSGYRFSAGLTPGTTVTCIGSVSLGRAQPARLSRVDPVRPTQS